MTKILQEEVVFKYVMLIHHRLTRENQQPTLEFFHVWCEFTNTRQENSKKQKINKIKMTSCYAILYHQQLLQR